MPDGNHLASQGQKEYNARGACSCGNLFQEIDWCNAFGHECDKDCQDNVPGMSCANAESRLRCPFCEIVVEAA